MPIPPIMQLSQLISQQSTKRHTYLELLNLDSWRAAEISPEAKMLMEQFPLLRELSLEGVGLQTLNGFPGLAQLKTLNLRGNQISSGLTALKDLGNLMRLDLSCNPLRYLSDLRPLVTTI